MGPRRQRERTWKTKRLLAPVKQGFPVADGGGRPTMPGAAAAAWVRGDLREGVVEWVTWRSGVGTSCGWPRGRPPSSHIRLGPGGQTTEQAGPGAGSGDHPRAEVPLVRLLRQAPVRSDGPVCRWAWRSTSSTAARGRTTRSGSAWSICRTATAGSSWATSRPGAGSRAACSSGGRVARTRCSGTTAGDERFVCHILERADRQAADAAAPFLHAQSRRPHGGVPGLPPAQRHAAGLWLRRAAGPEPPASWHPKDAGIWRIDLDTGKADADPLAGRQSANVGTHARRLLRPGQALVQPPAVQPRTARRFVFLHRWRLLDDDTKYKRSADSARGCSPPRPTARTCAWSIPTARPRTSSGATRSTSSPGPGTALARRRVLPLRGRPRARSKSSARAS